MTRNGRSGPGSSSARPNGPFPSVPSVNWPGKSEEKRASAKKKMDEIEAFSSDAPKRETLVRAAEILRDRHRARKKGEAVAPL